MMWPSFLSPWWFGIGLASLIPALIILYFLKLKRPRQEVPSLVLWRQVINDNRVNSPFQRFKRNLLLLLQLILLILLILAAMRPVMRGSLGQARRLPIIVDASASMGALDAKGGKTRLAEAKEQISEMIEGLPSDQYLAIISYTNTARKQCDFTNNKRVLRDALEKIKVEDVEGNLEQALRVTAAMAQTAEFQRALLITDGNIPAEIDFPMPFELDYKKLGPGGTNYGITAFNARRSEQGKWDVFALIEGSYVDEGESATIGQVTVELKQDGDVITSEVIELAEGYGRRMEFSIGAPTATSLELRIDPQGFDSLDADNVSYLDLDPARKLWVYAAPQLLSYRHALSQIPDVKLFPEPGMTTTAETKFDVVISDQSSDLAKTAPVRFFIGMVPEDVASLVTVNQDGAKIVDWVRTDPLFRYVQMREITLLDDVIAGDEVREIDFENAQFEIVVYGPHGPLMLRRREGGSVSYFSLFHTDNSTLPYRIGFPVMVMNMVEIGMNVAGLTQEPGRATGILPGIRLDPGGEYVVKSPSGDSRDAKADIDGMVSGVPASRVGRYVFSEVGLTGEKVAVVGASLLNSAESSLRPVEQIELSEKEVVASTNTAETDKSYWRPILFFALLMLTLEWWYFNRRVGGWRR